jgi:hypothetical protein
MRSTLRTSALAALAAGLIAAPAAQAQQTVRLPERDRPLALRTTPVFAVGTAEGAEWEMFTRVEQVAFDRADNLYVLDGGGARVLVFDRAGRFVRQVGRKGGGPGELQAPAGMALLADGTLAVSDLAKRSYSLFAADGKYLRSVPIDEQWMPVLGAGGLAAHPRGGVVAELRPAPQAVLAAGGPTRGLVTRSFPLVWQSFQEGAKPVRLYEVAQQSDEEASSSSPAPGQQRVSFRSMGPPEFSPPLAWRMLEGGGMVVSHTPGYTIRLLDAGGRPVRFIQRPMPVRKVTEADRERAREQRREAMLSGDGVRVVTVGGGGRGGGRRGLSREQVDEMVREMRFAETIPAIRDLRVDGAGRVWVERTGREWGEPGPIDLVTVDGRYLGTVSGQRLPEAFSASGRAAYVETDDLGVQRVVVRQLPRL